MVNGLILQPKAIDVGTALLTTHKIGCMVKIWPLDSCQVVLGASQLFEVIESVPPKFDNTGYSVYNKRESGTSVKFSPLNVSVEVFSLILEAAEDQVEVSSFEEQDMGKVSHPYGCQPTMQSANK